MTNLTGEIWHGKDHRHRIHLSGRRHRSPGGGEKFRHGGWSFEITRGKEGDQFKVDETQRSEALLLGRATYEGFAAAWPSRTGEFADKFNRMPKYVVSTTLKRAEWSNTSVIGRDVPAEVARLKKVLRGEIVVHGSARLAQTLIEHDLVDELRLMVFPVILGSGKRLFGETSDKKRWRLTKTQTVGGADESATVKGVRHGLCPHVHWRSSRHAQ